MPRNASVVAGGSAAVLLLGVASAAAFSDTAPTTGPIGIPLFVSQALEDGAPSRSDEPAPGDVEPTPGHSAGPDDDALADHGPLAAPAPGMSEALGAAAPGSAAPTRSPLSPDAMPTSTHDPGAWWSRAGWSWRGSAPAGWPRPEPVRVMPTATPSPAWSPAPIPSPAPVVVLLPSPTPSPSPSPSPSSTGESGEAVLRPEQEGSGVVDRGSRTVSDDARTWP